MVWDGLGHEDHYGGKERQKAEAERDARETAPLHSRIEQMLTEARVILPGAQALFGFQLAIVLTEAFEKLSSAAAITARARTALCCALGRLAHHPSCNPSGSSGPEKTARAFLRIGGRITIVALVPLAIGMAADCYVVLSRMFGGSGTAASIAAALVLFSLLSLWFAWPFIERSCNPAERDV